MQIRLLSNGRKWGTIAHAVEHQEFYDIDSQEKQLFQKYQVIKNLSTDA